MTEPTWKFFDGKRVNQYWYVFLTEARRAGVRFHLNSGKRTLSEQAYLYRLYQQGIGNLAAYPNPNAPHIRFNHACDVGPNNSCTQALINYGRRHGVYLERTVRGEFWHVEDTSGGAGLRKFYAKHKGEPTLREGMRGPTIYKMKGLLRKHGMRGFEYFLPAKKNFFSAKTKAAVIRFQKKKGLKWDGVVGPSTWKALKNVPR